MANPKLDFRSASEVRAQAQALAQHYLGSVWTGFDDPGDPGFQLIDLFSRMIELLVLRLNRVPDKNFLAFLDMVGVERSPGAPASVPVTFLPSAKALEGGPIPAGTQVATTQTDQVDAQVFETRDEIFTTPAKLVAAVNLLPGAELFSLVPLAPQVPAPSSAGTSSPETEILSDDASGLVALPHVLYLGGESLFGRKEELDVTVVFTVVGGHSTPLRTLRWEKFDKDAKDWVDVPTTSIKLSNKISVKLAKFGNNAKRTILGREDFWVRAHFDAPFPATEMPTLSAIQVAFAPPAPGFAAGSIDKAFANGTALDLSKPFKPFGERPRYGDAFYLKSESAFAPEVSTVRVTFSLKNYADADLTTAKDVTTTVDWQYLADDGTWKPLTSFHHEMSVSSTGIDHTITQDSVSSPLADGTFFGVNGGSQATFEFPRPTHLGRGKVQGEEGPWIRALLKSDDPYGKEASVSGGGSAPITVDPPTLIPPIVEEASLSFEYKVTPEPVPRVVTENNLNRVDHALGGSAPVFPITPFVSADQHPLAVALAPTVAFGDDSALYFAFDAPFGDVYISLYVRLKETFPTIKTPAEQGKPVIAWEYLVPSFGWKPLDVRDETSALSSSGTVSFVGPSDAGRVELFDFESLSGARIWYRARLVSGHYDHPPRLLGIFPNTVLADNRYTFAPEVVVGSGSGEQNQRITLLKAPVLGSELWVREPELPPETELEILRTEERQGAIPFDTAASPPPGEPVDTRLSAVGGEVSVRWRRVPNFLSSGPRSRHYTLDPVIGEIRFGDGKRGLLAPVLRDNLVVRDYRVGGGEAAVRAAVPFAVKELKSSLPFVEKVFNVEAATGGSDPWTLDEIFAFGPGLIKNKGRAVSAEDFESMVLERFSAVGRAKCLSTQAPGPGGLVKKPGAVTMVVVPKGREAEPKPNSALLRKVRDFLSDRCLGSIVSDVYALGPEFEPVTVRARIRARDPRQSSDVERRAVTALDDFFHPLRGGETRRGWDFGRKVQRSEVFAVLQRVPGVDYVERAEFVGQPATLSELDIGENNLVASGRHQIEMI